MQPSMDIGAGTGAPVRPLPPLPQPTSLFPPSHTLRRAMSETRTVKRRPLPPVPALPQTLLDAWEKENWIRKPEEFSIPYVPESKRKKYGYDLPTHPRDAVLKGKTLRHSPDSRRLNSKRDIDHHTVEMMREHLGDQGNVHSLSMKSSGLFSPMDANYAALEDHMDEGLAKATLEAHRQQGALDLAAPRKASVQSKRKSSVQSERRGSGATLLLPDFTLIRGSMPLSPGQGIPESPEPESSFEWDNPSPFGGPLFAPLWNQTWNGGRPSSLDETRSASRKASQPELDIELAKKPRPTTLPSSSRHANLSETERKRLGVILNPRM
ncbi:hypothetical protein B0J17DRAFT_27950 [Rhizoctonia solani]|nr:hypothetical protein B0J17DRAFT_27950 [Rhizoctonia solani]